MPGQGIITDEGTTVALIQAFATAYSDQAQAQSAVSGTQSSLAGSWKGQASGTFGGSLDEWKAGLQKVSAALESIRDSMVQFSQMTATTEDDNILMAQMTPTTGHAVMPGTPAQPASWT